VKLSTNITLAEFERSEIAEKHGITNKIPPQLIDNAIAVAEVAQLFRDYYRKPINITSGYRSKVTNETAGSRETSDHRYAKAIDFHIENISIEQIFEDSKYILADKMFRIILREGAWIHLSSACKIRPNRIWKTIKF